MVAIPDLHLVDTLEVLGDVELRDLDVWMRELEAAMTAVARRRQSKRTTAAPGPGRADDPMVLADPVGRVGALLTTLSSNFLPSSLLSRDQPLSGRSRQAKFGSPPRTSRCALPSC